MVLICNHCDINKLYSIILKRWIKSFQETLEQADYQKFESFKIKNPKGLLYVPEIL